MLYVCIFEQHSEFELARKRKTEKIYRQSGMEKLLSGLVIIKMGYVDTESIKRRNVSSMCVVQPSERLLGL